MDRLSRLMLVVIAALGFVTAMQVLDIAEEHRAMTTLTLSVLDELRLQHRAIIDTEATLRSILHESRLQTRYLDRIDGY